MTSHTEYNDVSGEVHVSTEFSHKPVVKAGKHQQAAATRRRRFPDDHVGLPQLGNEEQQGSRRHDVIKIELHPVGGSDEKIQFSQLHRRDHFNSFE